MFDPLRSLRFVRPDWFIIIISVTTRPLRPIAPPPLPHRRPVASAYIHYKLAALARSSVHFVGGHPTLRSPNSGPPIELFDPSVHPSVQFGSVVFGRSGDAARSPRSAAEF